MLRQNFTHVSEKAPLNNSGASPRLRHHKKWDDDGVASTVGTIMALMVGMTLLSLFTGQYVPVWMEENEASHMSSAYGQFATLKQAVDMQILAGSLQGTSQVQMFTPVKLGAEGIPMFAAPTIGRLWLYRSNSYNNISFSFNTTVSVVNYTTATGGAIQLEVANRYFTPQKLIYESDALILKQPDGEYMKATPQFLITRAGGNTYIISYTQVDLRGDDTDNTGSGTVGIQTTLRSVTTTTFTNLTDEAVLALPYLYINQTSWFGQTWYSAFNQTLSSSGMRYGIDYDIVSTVKYTKNFDVLTEVSVRINPAAISRFTLRTAIIELSTAEMGAA